MQIKKLTPSGKFDPSRDMVKGYRKQSVATAWKHHLNAFNSQNLLDIMQDYTNKSVVTAFDHTTGVMFEAEGIKQIAELYTRMWQKSWGTSLAMPVIKIMENTPSLPGSVLAIRRCPSCEVESGADTILFSEDNKIIRHNIAISSVSPGHGSCQLDCQTGGELYHSALSSSVCAHDSISLCVYVV